MRIGDVSRLTGFTRDTIRWYEKIGLVEVDKYARGSNNYRNYNETDLERLFFIKHTKLFGFTLKEIEALLTLECQNQLNCETVNELVDPKLDQIDQEILRLKQVKSRLQSAQAECNGDCKKTLSKNS